MSILKEEIPFQPSTLETVDYAVYNWITGLNIHASTNKGFKPVPAHWFTNERSQETKAHDAPREKKTGTIIFPIIVVERTSVVKDPAHKGTAYGNMHQVEDAKRGSAQIVVARRINQDKTSNFANADAKRKKGQINFPRRNKKVVYETISIPMPVYIDVTYEIRFRSQYQQQMNEIIQPLITNTGGINYFILTHEGHRFEGFLQPDFTQNHSAGEPGEDEQMYETVLTLKVLAYLIGGGKNQQSPKVVVRESAVDIKMPRERIITGDHPEHPTNQGYVGSEKLIK